MGRVSDWRRRRSAAAAAEQVRTSRLRWSQDLLSGRVGTVEAETREVMASCRGMPEKDGLRVSAWDIHLLALVSLGRHAEAEQGHLRLTAHLRAHGGAGAHLLAAKVRSDRAQNLVYLGRYREAEEECRALRPLAEGIDGPVGAAVRGAAANALVMALHGLGRFREAEAAARAAVEAASRAPAEASATAPEVYERLRQVLTINLARTANAQGRYQEGYELASAIECAVPSDTAAGRLVSAAALLGLGRPARAEADVREALTICAWGLSPIHHRALEAGTLLGSALAAQGRLADAERQLAANAAAWQEHFGSGHPRTAAATEALAGVRRRLGGAADAQAAQDAQAADGGAAAGGAA